MLEFFGSLLSRAPSRQAKGWFLRFSPLTYDKTAKAGSHLGSTHQTVRGAVGSGVRFGRRLGGLRLVGPPPTEQVSFVFGGHGGKYHHAHDQKDQQENDGNNQYWHTSPLRPFWNADARHAVIAITDGCEPTPQANVGRKREGNEVGEQLDVLVWRSDCEAKVLQLCGRQAGSPIRDGPRAAVANLPID
jgi:hypothetical protein